jgi:pyridoxamine 5'-phosphate oxidase family protein
MPDSRTKWEEFFSEREAEYLADNFLGRLATVSRSGQPHVVPVAYRFDGSLIYFGGWNLKRSLYYRNLVSDNRVAFVVDDILPTHPWRPRGVEVRGRAELEEGDENVSVVRLRVNLVRSWGLGE